MGPSPLLPYHVQLILQYIVPPSELTDPIPKHLLSRSLIQRHVFLELQPSDSASYLCWDAESRDRIVSLLESLHNPFDDLVSPLPVAYLVDDESAFAHVHVRSLGAEDLRIVFEWEESDSSWKYHDAGLMPFPPATHPTLDAALSSMVTADRKAVPDDVDSARSLEEGDEDSYWNAYGGADDDDQTSPDLRVTDAEKGGSDDEDAYWAQYSSVQGTADSTIPTPPHRSARRLVPAPEEPLPIPAATMIRPRSGPRDPPSPTTLASRLGHLEHGPWSIRPVSAPRSPPDYNFDDMVSQHAETEGDSQDGESASRSLLSTSELAPYSSRSSDVGGVDSDGSEPPKPVNLLSQQPASVGQIVGEDRSLKQTGGPEDDGVREVIRGAYRLWKAVHPGVGTQQDFARLVLNAIEGI